MTAEVAAERNARYHGHGLGLAVQATFRPPLTRLTRGLDLPAPHAGLQIESHETAAVLGRLPGRDRHIERMVVGGDAPLDGAFVLARHELRLPDDLSVPIGVETVHDARALRGNQQSLATRSGAQYRRCDELAGIAAARTGLLRPPHAAVSEIEGDHRIGERLGPLRMHAPSPHREGSDPRRRSAPR